MEIEAVPCATVREVEVLAPAADVGHAEST
jgi:hypothetical protein